MGDASVEIFSDDGERLAKKFVALLVGGVVIGLIKLFIPGSWLQAAGIALALVITCGGVALCWGEPKLLREPTVVLPLLFWASLIVWWLYSLITK